MKHPTEIDFEIISSSGGIEVIFNPTDSHYSYYWLADPNDIAQFGPISQDPRVRHAGPTGGTGEYRSDEVMAIAYRVALAAAGRR